MVHLPSDGWAEFSASRASDACQWPRPPFQASGNDRIEAQAAGGVTEVFPKSPAPKNPPSLRRVEPYLAPIPVYDVQLSESIASPDLFRPITSTARMEPIA